MISVRLMRATCAAGSMCRFSQIQRRTTPGRPSGKRTTTSGLLRNVIVCCSIGIRACVPCSCSSFKIHLVKGVFMIETPFHIVIVSRSIVYLCNPISHQLLWAGIHHGKDECPMALHKVNRICRRRFVDPITCMRGRRGDGRTQGIECDDVSSDFDSVGYDALPCCVLYLFSDSCGASPCGRADSR